MALISLQQARDHLKLPEIEEDRADVELKMEQATAIVINHLKRPNHGWTDDTDPAEDTEFSIVQAAILEVLGSLYAQRGDGEKIVEGPLTSRAIAMLSMLRDPALA